MNMSDVSTRELLVDLEHSGLHADINAVEELVRRNDAVQLIRGILKTIHIGST